MVSMKRSHQTIAAGLALVIPAYCGLFPSGIPMLLRPFPALTLIPAFPLAAQRLEPLVLLIPSMLFFASNPQLFRGEMTIPRRSLVFLALLTALSTLYFAWSWQYGLQYQGTVFTYGTAIANAGWLLLLWAVFVTGRARPSFTTSLLAHFLLFAWLGWYAFPYLGELP